MKLKTLYFQKLVSIILIAIAIIYSLSGVIYPKGIQKFSAKSIQPIPTSSTEMQGNGFAEGEVYPTTQSPYVTDNVKLYGSWLGDDRSTGIAYSSWYPAKNHFYLLVAGYPNLQGNSLTVEVSLQNGAVQEMRLNQENPGETWLLTRVDVGKIESAKKFRIRAIDSTTETRGWLGFSAPFTFSTINWTAILDIFRILTTTIAAIVIFISPGLILHSILFQKLSLKMSIVWLPLPGIGAMICIGLISWLSAGVISPRTMGMIFIIPYLIYLFYRSFKLPLTAFTSQLERRAILIFIVVVLVAVAKATYSLGPTGELYGGSVSRTLEVGSRSDSRISYHVVQLIAHGTDPYSELGTSYFTPWSFSHRGPLAGLAASPIVFLSGAKVPRGIPNQPWTPFDPQGFSAYRIAMSVMGASAILILFGLATELIGEKWGFMTLLIAATTPFIVHEVYFTWPKLQAGMIVLVAAYLLIRQRSIVSGLFVGIGYLFHPSALLSLPTLVCIALLKRVQLIFTKYTKKYPFSQIAISPINVLKFLSGVIVMLLLWRVLNLNNYAQSDFLKYMFEVELKPAINLTAWLISRINSLFNTIIPMNLFIFHQANPSINSIDGQSPAIIRFFFQYWNTLPFGIGIIYFFYLIRILLTGAFRVPYLFAAIVVLPLLSFTVYWGGSTTGMLREGLHAWIFAIILFANLIFYKFYLDRKKFWKFYNMSLSFRGLEILAMLVVPTLASRLKLVNDEFFLSDLIMLLLMLTGTAWLSFQAYSYGEELRKSVI